MKKILIAFLSCFVAATMFAQKPPAYWNDIQAFKKQDSAQAPPVSPILFVGSSSFTRWTNVQAAFPGYPILNRGFGGSVLTDVIRYAYDIILPYKPKQVVVYCGENDIASGKATAEEVTNRFKTLFAIIRINLPETNIAFVSIKPSPSRAAVQTTVLAANQAIRAFIKKQKNAVFIDVYPAMLDAAGNMREELYVEDRLHMKPAGYEIWQRIIAPHLAK